MDSSFTIRWAPPRAGLRGRVPKARGLGKVTIASIALLIGTGLADCRAQEPDSPRPLNGRPWVAAEEPRPFSFLAGGHAYGSPRNKDSLFPAASLLANLDRLNAHPAEIVFLLGDLVRVPDGAQLDALEASLLNRLEAPVFNAVGNHDVLHRGNYEERFGSTYFSFRHGSAQFVVLDTEQETPGDIAGPQLRFLLRSLDRAKEDPRVEVLFLLSHKLVWCVGNPTYRVVCDNVNAPYGYPESNRFSSEIEPRLRELAKDKHVAWISGDIGVDWSLPVFFHRPGPGEPTYVAAGLGDTQGDSLLEVTVTAGEPPAFSLIDLAPPDTPAVEGQTGESQGLESRGPAAWRSHFESLEAARPVPPGYFEQILRLPRSRRFWAGCLVGATPWLWLSWMRRRGGNGRSHRP